jgi:hypothetical protein
MNRRTKTKRRSTIAPSSPTFQEDYLDIDPWPHRWLVEPRDLAPGERMLDIFKPFLVHLLSQDLARKNCVAPGYSTCRKLHRFLAQSKRSPQ